MSKSDDLKKQALLVSYLSKLARAYNDISPLSATADRLLALATSALNLWFWVTGIERLERADKSCNTYVFLFAPVVASRVVRKIFIAMTTLFLVFRCTVFALICGSNFSSEKSWPWSILPIFDPRTPSEVKPNAIDKELLE